MAARPTSADDYPDDIFQDTRMTFGEHLEELRMRMFKALYGLGICLVIGFILDAVGEAVGNKNIGIGKPMLGVITYPVETQVRDFYYRRINSIAREKLEKIDAPVVADQEELVALRKLAKEEGLTALSAEQRRVLLSQPEEVPISIPVRPLAEALGIPAEKITRDAVDVRALIRPANISYLSDVGQTLLESRQYLTTLSAQEAFVVYFKVSILCGVVLSSPWLLYQFWAFVGAGLYPHEKKYVYLLLWPSVILFLSGVLLCQFVVLPGAVRALLKFNELLGFDPDLRLNEWLGLAIILPLVFGVSFQTPLVMVFLNRIGMFTAADYLRKWRGACFILAIFAAIITPTPDVVTMMYLFAPMFGLYLLGIAVCHFFPGSLSVPDEADAEEEIAV